jgi:hypothetical protein
VTHPIEPILFELAKRGESRVLAPILRDHIQHCSNKATIDIIVTLLDRGGSAEVALACSILRTLDDKRIEIVVAERVARGVDAVFDELAARRNIHALRKWVKREDFTVEQARKIAHLQDKHIRARCEIVLVDRTEERIARGRTAGIEAQLTWAKRDATYRAWLTKQTWFNPTLEGGTLEAYLPETIEATWAGHFAALMEKYTNFNEEERATLRRRLATMERHHLVDQAVISLWGGAEVNELDEYVRSTYMADEDTYEPAWVILKHLYGALGKNSDYTTWDDEATLQLALAYPRTRRAALRSAHLRGEALKNEVAAVLQRGAAGRNEAANEAAALCSNRGLGTEDADRLSALAGGPDLYILHRADLSPQARASILLREVELVETLHLLHQSCKIAGTDMGGVGAWFTLDVVEAFIKGQATHEPSGEQYARYANVAIALHPQTREMFALGARTWGRLHGAVAEAIAEVLAATNQPETLSGLLLHWSGTVGTLHNAAEKLGATCDTAHRAL